jgi:hypothetical protein
VCHAGAVSDHDGCSTEPLLGEVLDPVAAWLRAHRDQVVLLYVEDHLAGGGYPSTVATIKNVFGALVYDTGSKGGGCVELPSELTRNDVLRTGAQVVIVANSGCGEGADWRSLAFSWRNHVEATPHGFRAAPDCGPDFKRADYDSKLVRYYEDSTWLSAGATAFSGGQEGEGLTPANVREMTRCGVDLLGFDQLQPGDGRNDAAVWSWAEGQPGRSSCAVIGGDGRWYSSPCKQKRPAACRQPDGGWTVTDKAVKASDAATACARNHAEFDVPRTGYDNESLKLVTHGKRVLLGL